MARHAAARGGDASNDGHSAHAGQDTTYEGRQRPAPMAPSQVRGIELSSIPPAAPHMQHCRDASS